MVSLPFLFLLKASCPIRWLDFLSWDHQCVSHFSIFGQLLQSELFVKRCGLPQWAASMASGREDTAVSIQICGAGNSPYQSGLQQWQPVGLGQTEALKHKQLNVLSTNNRENTLCASSCTHFQGLLVRSCAGMPSCYCRAEFGWLCSRSKERNAGFTV